MEFINILLLGGLGAASIPFIIYLFNRSRFKIQPWGAMHLLDSAMAVNRRRIKIEQLLLLILRALIPGVLALCMARPVLTGMRNLIKNTKSSIVILLDNSFSMDGGDSVQSNFTIATEETSKVINALPRGSQAAVIGMAGPLSNEDASAYDLSQSRDLLESAWGSYGAAKVTNALDNAAALLAGQMHHADRQLLIVSDFQRTSWQHEQSVARSKAMELINSGPVKPRVILMNVGNPVKENIAVRSVRLSRSVIGINQVAKIRAEVYNYGAAPLKDLRVYLKVDGVSRSVSQVAVGAKESVQVLFSHRFDEAGSHLIEVLTDADSLKADNACRLSVPVLDSLPVLIVDGDPSREPLQGESAFLELALRPFNAGGSELKDMITVKVVNENDFRPQQLRGHKVLILANIRSLSDADLKSVEDFVQNGGGLIVFPGDKSDLAWYRDRAARDGGPLPMRLAGISGNAQGTEDASIVAQHYDHPALELFNDPRNGTLAGARIRLYYRLADADDGADREARRIIARLDSGAPFLVEKDFGYGRVIMSSVPMDADWSNLPLRPFFLPLMQQLVTYIASKVYPPRNLEVDQPVVAFAPLESAGKNAVLTDPNGTRHEVPIRKERQRGTVEWTQTRAPGVYLLEMPGGTLLHYVVNLPPEESNTERLTTSEIDGIASEMGAVHVSSYQEYRDLERERRFGQEIWVGLLWLVLIAAFGELFLIQFFARKRS